MELNIEGGTESGGTIGIVIAIRRIYGELKGEFPGNERIWIPLLNVRTGGRSISLGRGGIDLELS